SAPGPPGAVVLAVRPGATESTLRRRCGDPVAAGGRRQPRPVEEPRAAAAKFDSLCIFGCSRQARAPCPPVGAATLRACLNITHQSREIICACPARAAESIIWRID